MPGTLVIVGLCFLAIGAALLLAAPAAFRGGRWLGGGMRGLLGLLLLALAALAGTVTVGLRGYQALTYEAVAATVKTEPVAPHRFRATIVFPDRRLAMYELAGDAFYVDAHILKWHPWANLVGLHTAYELDRPRTVYSLGRAKPVDLFALVRQYKVLGPLVDAEYGSAAFVAGTRPAEYEVRVSTTGLLMRPVIR